MVLSSPRLLKSLRRERSQGQAGGYLGGGAPTPKCAGESRGSPRLMDGPRRAPRLMDWQGRVGGAPDRWTGRGEPGEPHTDERAGESSQINEWAGESLQTDGLTGENWGAPDQWTGMREQVTPDRWSVGPACGPLGTEGASQSLSLIIPGRAWSILTSRGGGLP